VGGRRVSVAEYELVFEVGSRENIMERLRRETGLSEVSLP